MTGRWASLADRLGLTVVERRGTFGRGVRALVGERNGYLLAVEPSHGLNQSTVDVLVRFPQRSTIRGLREDLLRDPALLAAFGRKRRLPRHRRKNFVVGDGSVLMRLSYAVVPPTNGRVERVVDGLTDAMSRHVRPLDAFCEHCNQPHGLAVYLADGVPGLFCESCVAAHEQGEREFAERMRATEPDYARGAGLGALAAVAIGLAAGSLLAAAVVVTRGPATPLALVVYAAVGLLTSGMASRGLGASSVLGVLTKLPFVLLAVAICFTATNAVATMTLNPAEWGLALLWSSSWRAAAKAPRALGLFAASALAGWLVESVAGAIARRRGLRKVRVEPVYAYGEQGS